MVQSGAELTRMKKREYHKAFLFWDHHGSGRDHRQTPEQTRAEIQEKLDSFTWKRNSAVIIFVPELEEWLWRCESALLSHWRIAEDQLQAWLNERAEKLDMTLEALKSQQPKELFEYVMRERLRRTISPRDFAEIGKQAGITGLSECGSFRLFVDVLREWFPMR
ncbi:MAG: hypothetical protein LBU39_01775 [Desulfobulbaceae bacterium]|nr:hypothetical protein [Desulfobulbaceae bacterium]